MGRAPLFPVFPQTGNSCYIRCPATVTSRSGIYLLDIASGISHSLQNANSTDTESYHSWSSNSRWIVFSSRRIDGLYTRPYFAYIDEEGNASKPFLLPQKDTDYYHRFMKSYNIPEFITGKVSSKIRALSTLAKEDKGIDVTYRK